MSKNVIEIELIEKNYQVGTQVVRALRGVTTNIERGDYVAIMGPSGSGKSTLMNIIGALDTPSAGTYVLNGTDVSRLTDDRLAEIRNSEIGFVFQTFNLLHQYSALENVILPLVYGGVQKAERYERGKMALDKVGLADRMTHKPNELSGGQRQRVAVARALINNPSIILADDPTGNLESKTSSDIMRLFNEIHAAGNTIILITHEEDIAQHAHRILRLRDGEIERDERNEHITKID